MDLCVVCRKGACKVRKGVPLTVDAADHKFVVYLRALVCDHCGDVGYLGPDAERAYRNVAGELARAGKVSGKSFRFMRLALGLGLPDLSALLDVSLNTLSRWEKERRAVDRTAWAILARIVLDELEGRDSMLDTLRRASSPRKLPKKVHVQHP